MKCTLVVVDWYGMTGRDIFASLKLMDLAKERCYEGFACVFVQRMTICVLVDIAVNLIMNKSYERAGLKCHFSELEKITNLLSSRFNACKAW